MSAAAAKHTKTHETALILVNETGKRIPRLPFPLVKKIKTKILGKRYQLSVVLVTDAKSRSLNRTYRKKNKPTNILSFTMSKAEGELYVNPTQIRRETKLFGRPFENLAIFLLIHGMFHLKGYPHGSRMEAKEKAARALFGI